MRDRARAWLGGWGSRYGNKMVACAQPGRVGMERLWIGGGGGICLYHQHVLIILPPPPPPSVIYFERKNIASSKTLMFIHCSYTLEWIRHSGIAWLIRWIQNHPPGKFRPAIHSESWNVWFGCFHWQINLIISSSSLSLARWNPDCSAMKCNDEINWGDWPALYFVLIKYRYCVFISFIAFIYC